MGKGSGASGARGGGVKSSGYTVGNNMTPQQVDAMHTKLAVAARTAEETRDKQMQNLGQSISNGNIPMSQLAARMEAIRAEYERKMEPIREANQKLYSKYGVFQQL